MSDRTGPDRVRPDFGLDAPPIVYGYSALGVAGVVLLIVAGVSIGSSVVLDWGNAARLAVTDRITLLDGDMARLPFPDASFDLALACLSIHNLHPSSRREDAVHEAVRVLRPGGRIAIVDIAGTGTYVSALTAAGLRNPCRTGYLFGIFPPARAVTANRT